MTYWLPSSGRLFLPPPTPVAQILDTDDFVTRTDIFYQTSTERLLTVGNPYYEVKDVSGEVLVPKVSGSQFRVFRLKLPDPNKFTFPNPNVYDPEKQRLVWAMRGIEISRGQPLGVGVTGHPFFNKFKDAENPTTYNTIGTDDRQNVCLDPKQVQMFIVGCTPADGEYWDKAEACKKLNPGDCPPLQLVNAPIEDGDMCDIGFGNLNFKALQATRSDVPLDIVNQIVKYPDFLKMCNEPYGNSMWFYAKREQLYIRHLWSRAGKLGEEIPPAGGADPGDFLYPSSTQKTMLPPVYFGSPSGSLVSSDQNIYNRPFWIHRAQGINNGICWNNQVFVTAVDSTRGTNFTISVPTTEEEEHERTAQYDANKFKQYSRHVEEYEISMIMQLCIVELNPETIAHLNTMNPAILEGWNLGFIQPPNTLEDQYRYITSQATRCPTKDDLNIPDDDPYSKLHFWTIDLSERFTQNLEQSNLGRKFLFQIGRRSNKRSAPKTVTFDTRAPKRRRKTVRND
ncbi:L1 [Rangifer tarandus papillomavirus 2]|uniref:Major capsid protein L1 n=1 Tax=Rangifer tarandus papillomavirus 2 TaxID=1370094 RepID=S5R5M5_9PAPI|nr:L1 [Rangifer tarandus papillomavirus 2]AGS08610.1 L1 [Rangifer tarandus papillomavirus 2]